MNMPITPTQAIEQMHQLLDQQSKAYRAMPVSTQRMDLDTIRVGGGEHPAGILGDGLQVDEGCGQGATIDCIGVVVVGSEQYLSALCLSM